MARATVRETLRDRPMGTQATVELAHAQWWQSPTAQTAGRDSGAGRSAWINGGGSERGSRSTACCYARADRVAS